MFSPGYFPTGYFGTGFFGGQAGDILVATSLAASPPSLDTGTLAQNQVFVASALAVSSPSIGAAAVVQKHVLMASAASAGSPTLGVPVIIIVSLLTALDAAAGLPVLPTLTFGQKYALTAALTPHSPTLGAGSLGQKHVVVPTNLAVSAPALAPAVLAAGRQFLAPNMASASPVIGGPLLFQKQSLIAVGTAAGAPVLAVSGRPISIHVLVATGLTVVTPTIPSRALGFSYLLHALNLTVDGPSFGVNPAAEETGPPRLWFTCRDERWSYDPTAKWYDEDHDQDEKPVKQSIFTNLNDDLELTVSSLTLVGRTLPERGPAQAIEPSPPLYLFKERLRIDIDRLAEELAGLEVIATLPTLSGVSADINLLNDKILSEIAARTAAVTAEANARTAADAALDARLAVLETRSYVDRGGVAIIAPASGFVHQVAADAGVVILNPTSNLSSGTFKLPIAPAGRQKIDFIAIKNVSNLTFVTDNGAHVLGNPPTSTNAGKCITAVFGPTLSTWVFFA